MIITRLVCLGMSDVHFLPTIVYKDNSADNLVSIGLISRWISAASFQANFGKIFTMFTAPEEGLEEGGYCGAI